LVPVRRIALFFKIPEFSGSYVDRVYDGGWMLRHRPRGPGLLRAEAA
jgi:hypothetical protein